MPDDVFCRDCLHLVVTHPESNGRIEATHDIRQNGVIRFTGHAGSPRQYVPTPACHAGQRPEWNTLHLAPNPDIRGNIEAFAAVMEKPVRCNRFQDYEPGRGPKELDEMNAHQATLDVQQKLLSLQQSVFEWRQQQAEKDEKFAQRIQAIEQLHHNENLGVAKTGAGGSKWQAIGTIAAAVISMFSLIIAAALAWRAWPH